MIGYSSMASCASGHDFLNRGSDRGTLVGFYRQHQPPHRFRQLPGWHRHDSRPADFAGYFHYIVRAQVFNAAAIADVYDYSPGLFGQQPGHHLDGNPVVAGRNFERVDFLPIFAERRTRFPLQSHIRRVALHQIIPVGIQPLARRFRLQLGKQLAVQAQQFFAATGAGAATGCDTPFAGCNRKINIQMESTASVWISSGSNKLAWYSCRNDSGFASSWPVTSLPPTLTRRTQPR